MAPRFRCPSPRLPLNASPLSLPISPPTAAPAPWPSRNFTDSAKPKYEGSKPSTPWPPSNSPSPSTGSAIRAVDPDHLVLRPRKMRSGQRFSYLALEPEETRALNAAYHERIHQDQSNLIPLGSRSLHPNRSRTPGQRPLPPKRHGPGWPSPGAGLPRSSLAPPSASLGKNSPIPPSSLTANWKTRQAPGTSFEPYPIPVLGDPKKIIQALDILRDLRSFPSPAAVNTTTGPQLPKYVSAAFGSLDLPWKPGHLRSAYGAICCHKFKPKNQTDDIFLAQILGHKLLGPNASLSVGQTEAPAPYPRSGGDRSC